MSRSNHGSTMADQHIGNPYCTEAVEIWIVYRGRNSCPDYPSNRPARARRAAHSRVKPWTTIEKTTIP